MRQVALIALYGSKPSDLSELIIECQKAVSDVLSDRFHPYDLQQVHATIVGLERGVDSLTFNLNLARYRNNLEEMDFKGLLRFMRQGGRFPLQVQIGGFRDRDYPFTSQGRRPYSRSFSIQSDKAVLMGWPIRGHPLATDNPSITDIIQEGRIYPNTLDEIRQAFQSFNILHTYHRIDTDVDNDFYFRIGLLDQPVGELASQQRAEETIRGYLSRMKPIITEIALSNIYIASYENETLPLSSTRAWPIYDKTVDSDFITSLYE